MEFGKVIETRRSVRKYLPQRVERDLIQRILSRVADHAPAARNIRSTRFLAVDDAAAIARIAAMRDYGSAFAAGAPCAVLVMGDPAMSDLWRENAAIAATMVLHELVDAGLAGCWIHVEGRPCLKAEPQGRQAEAALREFLPVPEGCRVLCVIACGYSDFTPAPLPDRDRTDEIRWFPE